MRELATIYSNEPMVPRLTREWCCTSIAPHPLHGYKNAVVRTTDTYIFVIQLPPSKLTVYHDTGSGKHRQLINLSDLAVSLGEDYCVTLLGCIQWRRLYKRLQREGEGGALKKLDKNSRFHKVSCNSVRNGISSLPS